MIFAERDASQFRCCGPEGCGAIFAPPPMMVEFPAPPDLDLRPGPIQVTHGDPVVVTGPRFCIGAKCAAWIWRDPEFVHAQTTAKTEDALKPPPPPSEGKWSPAHPPYGNGLGDVVQQWTHPWIGRKGQCGLIPLEQE